MSRSSLPPRPPAFRHRCEINIRPRAVLIPVAPRPPAFQCWSPARPESRTREIKKRPSMSKAIRAPHLQHWFRGVGGGSWVKTGVIGMGDYLSHTGTTAHRSGQGAARTIAVKHRLRSHGSSTAWRRNRPPETPRLAPDQGGAKRSKPTAGAGAQRDTRTVNHLRRSSLATCEQNQGNQ